MFFCKIIVRDDNPIHITNLDIREALLPIERVVMIVYY